MDKKEYSVDELLLYAYKYNRIPSVLFAKDKDCRYIYTSEIEDAINGGEENSILGKTDMDIQYDPELRKMYYEQDKEIMRTGEPVHCYSEFYVHGKKEVREISKNPIYRDGEIIGVSGVVSDVTELMRLKEQYEKLSMLDKSTGCYNRNYFLKNNFNGPENLPCAYIMCDCNNLKVINDQYGHETGDKYILLVSDVLRLVADKKGICIRWGGDEFLIITPNCNETEHNELIEKINMAQRRLSDTDPEMGLSVGGKVRESMEIPESSVMKQADETMYENKRSARS